jgi:hypothetical protein
MQLTYYDHKAGQHLIMKRYKWALWGFLAGTMVGILLGLNMSTSYY